MLAIAGSRQVHLPWVTPSLMQLVATLPSSTIVLLRGPRNQKPNPFERTVQELCEMRELLVLYVVPEAGRNRVGTFVRDVELVASADTVIVFLAPDEDPLGDSGTAHVLQKAIDQSRPLYAYTVGPDGLEWIGGIDTPHSQTTWSNIVSDIAKFHLT